MNTQLRIALIAGALVLALGTATSVAAAKPTGDPPRGKAKGHTPGDATPGPRAGLPAKAKAYGRYCKGESKRHVKGEKGTVFSRCVTAMAKATKNDKVAPGRACKGLSKRHVRGEKGTEFSRCVKAAAKLRGDRDGEEA